MTSLTEPKQSFGICDHGRGVFTVMFSQTNSNKLSLVDLPSYFYPYANDCALTNKDDASEGWYELDAVFGINRFRVCADLLLAGYKYDSNITHMLNRIFQPKRFASG